MPHDKPPVAPEPEHDQLAGDTTPPEPVDEVLAYAWELYETYSDGSQTQKKANSGIRQNIIWLIFLTSVLAVVTTLPYIREALEFLALWLTWSWGDRGEILVGSARFALSATLIVLSVATTSLLSYASQFTPLKAWVMYRVGADRIRTQIYLYRMNAGPYAEMRGEPQKQRDTFLERIEQINQQIYEIETAPPFLQLEFEAQTTYNYSRPRIWANRLRRPLRALFRPKQIERKGVVRRVDSKVARGGERPKRLPGRYYIEHDDGFNPLDVETYIQYRVLPQRDWYVNKVYEDYERIKDWRKVVLFIGGASAVLAAIQLEPYIVITTAAVVAVNTHIQLNLIGSTYGNYHITASRIDSVLVRWRNSSESERQNPERISEFVATIEDIFEDERAVWMQQASQAQKESEQTLIKGATRRGGETAEGGAGVSTPAVVVPVAPVLEQGGGPSDSAPNGSTPNGKQAPQQSAPADKNEA